MTDAETGVAGLLDHHPVVVDDDLEPMDRDREILVRLQVGEPP